MPPELVEHRTTNALIFELDGGPVVVYGALIPGSWEEFGVGKGTRVEQGQPLGRVGTYPFGDEMLHIEARRPGTRTAKPWHIADGVPASLLNVTPLLQAAKSGAPGPTPEPSPSPSPSPIPTPDLPLSRERWLQLALRQLVDGTLAVDGQIGPATRAAIRKFQKSAGLAVDGIAGPQTFAALERASGGQPPVWDEAALGPFVERLKQAFRGAWKDVFG